jgi:hypothetical protein
VGGFLRENWIWIVAPIVLVAAAVLWLLYTGSDDAAAPFQYTLF